MKPLSTGLMISNEMYLVKAETKINQFESTSFSLQF